MNAVSDQSGTVILLHYTTAQLSVLIDQLLTSTLLRYATVLSNGVRHNESPPNFFKNNIFPSPLPQPPTCPTPFPSLPPPTTTTTLIISSNQWTYISEFVCLSVCLFVCLFVSLNRLSVTCKLWQGGHLETTFSTVSSLAHPKNQSITMIKGDTIKRIGAWTWSGIHITSSVNWYFPPNRDWNETTLDP